jgi:site-specific recombinase XerD
MGKGSQGASARATKQVALLTAAASYTDTTAAGPTLSPSMPTSAAPTPAAQGELDEWLNHLTSQGRRRATITSYRTELRRFLAAYPTTPFTDFTFENIMAFLNALDERRRPRAASVLRNWFRWGETTDRVTDDPTRLLPKYKWQRAGPVREIFTEEEIQALKDLPYPHGILMEILFETGIKKNEAHALTARCCELDGPAPQLRIVEGRHPRVIPITDPQFAYRLAHYITTEYLRPDDHLWFSRPGGGRSIRRDRPVSDASMHKWWTDQLQRAGIEHRMMRTARSTFARRMRAKGVGLDDIQLLMGHKDYYTTSEYYADDRYPSAEALVRSVADAQSEARALRDLLHRVLPHLVAQGSPETTALAKEIGSVLTNSS